MIPGLTAEMPVAGQRGTRGAVQIVRHFLPLAVENPAGRGAPQLQWHAACPRAPLRGDRLRRKQRKSETLPRDPSAGTLATGTYS